MDKLVCKPIYTLFSFINEMKHLSISQWEVEPKAIPSSSQTIPQQNDGKMTVKGNSPHVNSDSS